METKVIRSASGSVLFHVGSHNILYYDNDPCDKMNNYPPR